jgi:hypothetical protein
MLSSLRFIASAYLLGVAIAPIHAQCVATGGQPVPSSLVAGRWFVYWNVAGQRLRLYTDTGGGNIVLYPEAVRSLGFAADTTYWRRGADSGRLVTTAIPESAIDSVFPPIPEFRSVQQVAGALRLNVAQEPARPDADGFSPAGVLGSAWFADRVWTLDYPNARLLYHDRGSTSPAAAPCWTPLGFQTTSDGWRTNHFPRVTMRVDGESIEMLLDTGARVEVTEAAQRLLADSEPRHRGTSFITRRRFEQWHAKHPSWRVLRAATEGFGFDMIEVPRLELGEQLVGPAWFTVLNNENFETFMSQYMDRPIEGALGGSALRHVRVVLDYPRARAAFLAPDRDF